MHRSPETAAVRNAATEAAKSGPKDIFAAPITARSDGFGAASSSVPSSSKAKAAPRMQTFTSPTALSTTSSQGPGQMNAVSMDQDGRDSGDNGAEPLISAYTNGKVRA